MISVDDVRYVIFHGKIIEEYTDDPRGASCLMFAIIEDRCIHIVCSPKKDYLAVVTAYAPDLSQWSQDCERRL